MWIKKTEHFKFNKKKNQRKIQERFICYLFFEKIQLLQNIKEYDKKSNTNK